MVAKETLNTTHHSTQLNYRSDIQGLRALAIILVVFCHAGLPGFMGGFIGVDIFFVLSGYLITGLLLRESEKNGNIKFLQFYSRRFKRLLPALIFVTLATMSLAYFILAPFEQDSQASAVYSVPIWGSNFYFSFSDFNYFDPAASNSLFLHTWSLAVEEQFYLVWPLLIFLLLFKVQHADPAKNKHDNNLLYGLGWLLLTSLALNIYWAQNSPILSFYLMPSRAWQFALGGIVFVLGDRFQQHTFGAACVQKTLQFSGTAGLILVIIPLAYLGDSSVYPGLNAVMPSLGTALIIFSGLHAKEQILTRVLSLKWMQKIGDISYSWYLWHWPVLVLGSFVFPQESLGVKLILVGLSYILAYLSYVLIESPTRNLRVLSTKPLVTVSSSLAVMIMALVLVYLWDTQAEKNARTPEQLPYIAVKNDLPVIYQNGCDDWYTSARVIACGFGNNNAEKTAILLGDSIGVQWFSALAQNFTVPGWRFVVFTKSSCPIVDVPIFYDRIGAVYEVCSQWRDDVIESIKEISPSSIFIGSSSGYSYSQEEWQTGTQEILAELSPVADNIFIIPSTHILPFDGPACLARNEWQPNLLSKFSSCSYSVSEVERTDTTALANASAIFQNVFLLNLNFLVCPDESCNALNGDMIVYRDNQHLSNNFVLTMSEPIRNMIQNVSKTEL